jgi:hypothetical protein
MSPLIVYLIALILFTFIANIVIFLLMCKEESDTNKDKPTNLGIGAFSLFILIIFTGGSTLYFSKEGNQSFIWISSFVNAIVYFCMFLLYTRVIIKKLKYGNNICYGDDKNRMKHVGIFSGIVLGAMIVSTLIVHTVISSYQKSKNQNLGAST